MGAEHPLKIGFSRNLAIGIPFWTIAEHGAAVRARELGVTFLPLHSVNARVQAEHIAQLIQQRVDAIVVAATDPSDADFLAALDAAHAAGIPLIAVDVVIAAPVVSLVRSDDVRGATCGMTYLAEQIGGQGKIVHFQGNPQSPVAKLRTVGVRQVLEQFPGLELVLETADADWDRVRSHAIMQDILAQHADICGVFAANDPMALGAIAAIEEAGRAGQIVVIGVDGDPDALLAVESGKMAATVRRSPYQLGRVAIETAVAAAQGTAVPPEILIDDMTLVTPANVAHSAIESLSIMPGVIDELMQSSVAITAERTMLRTIIDSLPDLIYVKDHEGRFVVANAALAHLSGLDDAQALIGKTDHDVFPQQLASQYQSDEQHILQSGVPVFDKEEPVRDAHGEQHWLVTTKIPLRDHNGQIQWLVGRSRDITDRKHAAEERQRLQEELIVAQAAALEELSTPLIPISDSVLVMPLIGRVDSRRASQILEALLVGVQEQQANLVIVDITGVNVVDTQVGQAIIQAARAVKLLGAQVMLTGIRPEVAQTLVALGIDLADIMTHSSLQRGIAYALHKRSASSGKK
ncbi:MAG TPA: substrate-binding domain-containing protein [Roseiflexaceae bacterium]|nr:substrate-binding domain-containing protein [Roseiflexaceae bacterium]